MSVVTFEEMEAKRQEMVTSFKDVATAMTRCVAIIEDFARVSPNVIPHAAALSTIESGALIAEGLAAVVAGNAAAANAVAGKKVRQRKEKKSKDPNAPKRPPSAYLLFQNEVREKVKTEHPDMAYRELLGVIAQRWKALTEEQKNTYENSYSLATEDFRRRDTAYKLDGTILPPAPGIPGYTAAALVEKPESEDEDEDTSSSEDEPAPVVTPSKKEKKRKGETAKESKKKAKKGKD